MSFLLRSLPRPGASATIPRDLSALHRVPQLHPQFQQQLRFAKKKASYRATPRLKNDSAIPKDAHKNPSSIPRTKLASRPIAEYKSTSVFVPPMPMEEIKTWYEEVFEKNEKRGILVAYVIIGVFATVTAIRAFPIKMFQEVQYPHDLYKYRDVKLGYIWDEDPLAAIRVFWTRFRKGDYKWWIVTNFSMQPTKILVPKEGESVPWWTVMTSLLQHSSGLHLLSNSIAAYTLIGQSVAPVVGPAIAVAAWLGCGVGGALLELGWLRIVKQDALKNGEHLKYIPVEVQKRDPGSGEKYMVTEMHPKPEYRHAVQMHVGSSGGLMGLLMITGLMSPGMQLGVPFLPIHFSVRTFAALVLGWDVAGEAGLWGDDGVNHLGHLAGDLVGVLIWFGVLRKMPNIKVWQKTRFFRGE